MDSTLANVDPRSMHRLCYRSVEFRSTGEPGDGRTLEGYAAVFDAPTLIESSVGTFEEVIKRGAFRKTLTERDPVMQFDHGNDKRTGSTPIGAIKELREDDHGLFVRARLFDNELVEPIRQAIEGGAVRGMSFKFRVVRDQWLDSEGRRIDPDDLAGVLADPDQGTVRREIREVELFELGPVVFPAYRQTTVGVRSVFDPSQVALRGVIAQFGLDPGCIRRHLSIFDEDARRALAEEIAESFPELVQVLAQRTAVPSHDTSTVNRAWDASTHERRLSSPMSLATARAMYAWYDGDRVEDGQIVKDACKLPHHEVSDDGRPGPANLNGVRNALARLPQSDIPAQEHEAVRRHLRAHLEAAGGEDDEASAEPTAVTRQTNTEPVSSHSERMREIADWYLPLSNELI